MKDTCRGCPNPFVCGDLGRCANAAPADAGRKCAVYGPADFWLCDKMSAQVDRGGSYQRNPEFGWGGRMDLSVVLFRPADLPNCLQVETCPFCGGSLKGKA